jgi:peptidoglycan/LPS O-acetylase OafA/YrhL
MNNLHSKGYRPDIDGLRAVAILGVLLFHLDKSLLPGGFLGVDVFFVISGYLITSIIKRDIDGEGFSIARFYERRIRRIMPAFFVLILAVLLAACVWILPAEIVPFGKSMRYALFSFGNVYFLSAAQDYFNSEAAKAPLLHTWSLGVEEQFYFVFPFVLLGLSRLCKRQSTMIAWVSLLLMASLVACLHKSKVSAPTCFFLLPYRAWQMLAGALLAFMPLSGLRPSRLMGAMGWAGLGLILASMVLVSEADFRPGLMALPSCVGAMMLILAGTPAHGSLSASRLLSWRPIVGLGLISYSVYLWHWPLIVFRENYLPQHSHTNTVILATVSLIFGWASWKWVEKPFRRPGFLKRRTIFISWASLALTFLGVGMIIKETDGLIQRYSPEVRAILKARERNEDFPTEIKENWSPESAPIYGDKSQAPSIALWGDSHAHALMPWLDKRAKEARRAVKLLSMDGQIPVPGLVVRGEHDEDRMRCVNESMKLILESNTIDTVILHARWAFYLEGYNEAAHEKNPTNVVSYHGQPQQTQAEREAFYANQIREGISQLLQAGKKVALIYPVPEARINIPDFLARELIEGRPLVESISLPSFAERQRQPMAVLESIPDHPKLVRIKPHERLMNNEQLTVLSDGKPLYIDDDHLSVAGLDFIEDLLDAALPLSANQAGD